MFRFNIKRCLLLPLIIFTISSCDGNIYTDETSQIIIEGYIENTGEAYVFITTSLNVSEIYEKYIYIESQNVVKGAKVTVIVKGKDYPLYGYADSAYLIPYVYKANKIPVTLGDTCKLEIEHNGKKYTSTAIMPQKHIYNTLEINNVGDNKYSIVSTIEKQEQNFFARHFVMTNRSKGAYMLSALSGVTGITDDCHTIISRPLEQLDPKYSKYFNEGDTVIVRLSVMSEEMYNFWSDFEARLDLSRNPLFPITTNIEGNIENVKGYWAAYVSTFNTIIIPESH